MGESIHVRPIYVVRLWRLVERQTIIEEIIFHINTKADYHFCLMGQASVILCRKLNMFLYALTFARLRGRC